MRAALWTLFASAANAVVTNTPTSAPTTMPTSGPTSGAAMFAACGVKNAGDANIASGKYGSQCPCFAVTDGKYKGNTLGWMNQEMKKIRAAGVSTTGSCGFLNSDSSSAPSWGRFGSSRPYSMYTQDYMPVTAPTKYPTHYDPGLTIDATFREVSENEVPGFEKDPDRLSKDFNCGSGIAGVEPSLVLDTLDESGMPVLNKDSKCVENTQSTDPLRYGSNCITSRNSFHKWYHDSPETVTYSTAKTSQQDAFMKPLALRAVKCRQRNIWFSAKRRVELFDGADGIYQDGHVKVYQYADAARRNQPYSDVTTHCECDQHSIPFNSQADATAAYGAHYNECKPRVPRYIFVNKKYLPLYNKTDVNGKKASESKKGPFFFTTHIATEFLYQGHEYFRFSGDDDVWVFINNVKVLDLGGLHGEDCRRIDLSTAYSAPGRAEGYIDERICGVRFRDKEFEWVRKDGSVYSGRHMMTLERGATYKLDIFQAERCATGSNFYMETNLKLQTIQPATGNTDLCMKMSWDRKNLTASFQKKRLVRPVVGFNSQHPVVTKKVCGGANTGDPIPAVGKWSTSGNKDPKHYSCAACCDCTFSFDEKTCSGAGQVYGGSLFYAYNYPRSSSSNTGMEEKETESIFFVKDANNNVFLVLNHDKPYNKGGAKNMRLSISSPKLGEAGTLANKGVFVQLRDDYVVSPAKQTHRVTVGKGHNVKPKDSDGWGTTPFVIPEGFKCPTIVSNANWDKATAGQFQQAGDAFETVQNGTSLWIRRIGNPQPTNWGVNLAFDCFKMPSCLSANNDCYAWDTTTGQGTFAWSWSSCCTDGMVLGPLPGTGFTINLEYTKTTGLDHFKIGDYDNYHKSLNLIDLTYGGTKKDRFFSDGIKVDGFSCKDYCESITTCGGCTSDPACGWCAGAGAGVGTCSSIVEESEKSTCATGGGSYHPSGCEACKALCAFAVGEPHTCEVCTAKPAGCGFMIADPYTSWQTGTCLPGNSVSACTVDENKAPLYFSGRDAYRMYVGPTATRAGGPNGNKKTPKGSLNACVGECDRTSDCKTGLKCFERSKGEPIPGCETQPINAGIGNYAGNTWDFCYDPDWVPTTDDSNCALQTFDIPPGYTCPTVVDKNNWAQYTSTIPPPLFSFTTKVLVGNKLQVCRSGGVPSVGGYKYPGWSYPLAFDCFKTDKTVATLTTPALLPMNISQGFTLEAWVYPTVSYALPFIALTNSEIAGKECFAVEGVFSKLDAWVHVAAVYAPIAVNPTNLYLAGAKQSECNAGDMKVNKYECSDANDAMISKMSLKPAGRKMTTYMDYPTNPPGRGWAGVPSGCSMQWDGKHGDRTAHLKMGPTSDVNKAAQNQIYRLLCIETSTGSPNFLTVYLDGVETTQKPVMAQECAAITSKDKWTLEIGGSTTQGTYIMDMAISSFIVFDHARLFDTVREDMRDLGCATPFWLSDAAKVGPSLWTDPVLAQILFEDLISPFVGSMPSKIVSTTQAGLTIDTQNVNDRLIAAVNLSTRAGCSSPESASYKERWMSVCTTPFPTLSPTLTPTPGPTPFPTISPTEYPTTALDENKYPACPAPRLETTEYEMIIDPVLDRSGCCSGGLAAGGKYLTGSGATRAQCKAACSADPACTAFEIGGCSQATPQCLGHCLMRRERNIFSNDAWRMAARPGWTCDKECGRYGATCDIDAMASLNTYAKAKAAFKSARYTCKTPTWKAPASVAENAQHRSYAGSPFATGRARDDCYFFKADGTNPAPVCNKNLHKHHRALCKCKVAVSFPLVDRSLKVFACGRTKRFENECHVKVVKKPKGGNMASKVPVQQAVVQSDYGSRIVMYDEPCTKYASCRNATCSPKISSCGDAFIFKAPWNGTEEINKANGKYNPCGKEPSMEFSIVPKDTSLTVCEAAEKGFGAEWEERCARACEDDACYQQECTMHSHHDAKVAASTPTSKSTNPFFPLPASLSWPDGAEDTLTFKVTTKTLGNAVGINRVELRFVGLRHAKVGEMSIKLTSPDGKTVNVMQSNKNPCAKNHMGGNLEFCGLNCVEDDRWKIAKRRAATMADVDERCIRASPGRRFTWNWFYIKGGTATNCIAGEYQRMVLGPASGAKYGGTYTFTSDPAVGTAMQCAANDEQMGGNVGRGAILSTALQELTGKLVQGVGEWNLTLGDSRIGMTGFFDHVELILYPVTTNIPARYLPEALTLAYAPTPDNALILDNKGRPSSNPEKFLRVGAGPAGFDPANYPEWSESIKLWYQSPQAVGMQGVKYKQVFGCYPKKQFAQLDIQTLPSDSAPTPPAVWADNIQSSSFTLKWAFTATSTQGRRRLSTRPKLQLTPTQVSEGMLVSVEASLTVNTHWLCWRSGSVKTDVKTGATCAAQGSAQVVISAATTGTAAVCGAVNIETAQWNDLAVTKTELFVSVIECSTASTAATGVVAFVSALTHSRITPVEATVGASLSVSSLTTSFLCWKSGNTAAANPTATCGTAATLSSFGVVEVAAATTGAATICGKVGQTSATWSDATQVKVAVIECSATSTPVAGSAAMTTLAKALTIVLWKSGGLDDGWRIMPDSPPLGQNAFPFTGLMPGKTYSFEVQAVDPDSGVAGAMSDPVTVQTCPARCSICGGNGICDECDPTSIRKDGGTKCQQVFLENCPAEAAAAGDEMQNMFGNGRNPGEDPTGLSSDAALDKCRPDTVAVCQNCDTCPIGHQRNGCSGFSPGVCEKCGPNTFKSETGSRFLDCEKCTLCDANSYAAMVCDAVHNTVCAPCPLNSTSLVGSIGEASCKCQSGFYRDENSCVPCNIDHCDECNPAGCTKCEVVGDTPETLTPYYVRNGACVATCYDGEEYAALINPVDSQSGRECRSCPVCPRGFGLTNCEGESAGSCDYCSPGSFRPEGKKFAPCEACTQPTPGDYASVECYGSQDSIISACQRCEAGSFRVGCNKTKSGSCNPCAEGMYKDWLGTAEDKCLPCWTCPEKMFRSSPCTATSDTGVCRDCGVCLRGQYQQKECSSDADVQCGACPSCPAGYQVGPKVGGDPSVVDDLKCGGAENPTDPGVCVPCVSGKFKAARYSSPGGNSLGDKTLDPAPWDEVCLPCTKCNGDEFALTPCSGEIDNDCRPCASFGRNGVDWYTDPLTQECETCTRCGTVECEEDGEVVPCQTVVPCSLNGDALCGMVAIDAAAAAAAQALVAAEKEKTAVALGILIPLGILAVLVAVAVIGVFAFATLVTSNMKKKHAALEAHLAELEEEERLEDEEDARAKMGMEMGSGGRVNAFVLDEPVATGKGRSDFDSAELRDQHALIFESDDDDDGSSGGGAMFDLDASLSSSSEEAALNFDDDDSADEDDATSGSRKSILRGLAAGADGGTNAF